MKVVDLAVKTMLFETCGEDIDLVMNAEIEEILPSTFHITYKKDNQFEGLDLVVEIELIPNIEENDSYTFKYTILESVYGDVCEFIIE